MASEGKGIFGWAILVGSLAFFLLIMAIIFGNLSGNVGFATGTQGYNDTQAIIGNYTSSATNTASQFPVVGTIIGVALLLLVLIGILIYAMTKMSALNVGGKSNGNFG